MPGGDIQFILRFPPISIGLYVIHQSAKHAPVWTWCSWLTLNLAKVRPRVRIPASALIVVLGRFRRYGLRRLVRSAGAVSPGHGTVAGRAGPAGPERRGGGPRCGRGFHSFLSERLTTRTRRLLLKVCPKTSSTTSCARYLMTCTRDLSSKTRTLRMSLEAIPDVLMMKRVSLSTSAPSDAPTESSRWSHVVSFSGSGACSIWTYACRARG